MVNELQSEGCEVFPLDILSEDNAITVDVTDLSKVKAILGSIRPDVVIHLAAMVGRTGKTAGAESMRQPYEYFNVNVAGTLSLFETSRCLQIGRIVCLSSFSAYGIADCPIDEETMLHPTTPYGYSKVCMEEIARCYATAYGIKTVIFRPTLVCGEGQRELNVLREFVTSALCDVPLTVLGEGSHVREFLHPQDVVRAISTGINYLSKMETPYDVFVLGNKPISMVELAALVIRNVGKGSIVFKPATSQVFDQFTNHSKARRVLGWAPTIGIDELVGRVVEDVKSHPPN